MELKTDTALLQKVDLDAGTILMDFLFGFFSGAETQPAVRYYGWTRFKQQKQLCNGPFRGFLT